MHCIFTHQRSWLILFVTVCLIGFDPVPAKTDQPKLTPEQRELIKQNAVRKWQSQFGPVDFADTELFQCMVYVHPQPKSAFRDFRGVKLAERLTLEFQLWLHEFFKKSFNKTVNNLKPAKYYLNEGRIEASLLLYELQFDRTSITIVENHNVLFLTITPNGYDAQKGIQRQQLAELLFDWINLQYQSVDDLARNFRLPVELKIGDVFTNRLQPKIARIGDWKEYVIGFVSKEGICIMLFKTQGNRMVKGFPYDFNWLNKGLYQEDGKMLVAPPENSSSNDPWSRGPQDKKTK